MILDVLRVSLSRNVGYDFIAKMFDTILDVLRASLSRNIGYNVGCVKGLGPCQIDFSKRKAPYIIVLTKGIIV